MWHGKRGFSKFPILQLAVGGSAALMIGCAPVGPAAGHGTEYTRQILSLYNDPAVGHGPRTIEFPITVAVAQIGEASPTPAVMEKLRDPKSRDVFSRVESLPAQESDTPDPAGRNPVRRLQSMARDQGADYLLLYGATVDSQVRVNPLSIIDLTIVGCFMPGTETIAATSRGSAALIDVRTGTVVLTAGSEESSSTRLGSAVTHEADLNEHAALAQNKSLAALGDQIVATAKRRAAEESAVDNTPAIRHATSIVVQEK